MLNDKQWIHVAITLLVNDTIDKVIDAYNEAMTDNGRVYEGIFYMNKLDDVLEGYTPTGIMEMYAKGGFQFYLADDYFVVEEYTILKSFSASEIREYIIKKLMEDK